MGRGSSPPFADSRDWALGRDQGKFGSSLDCRLQGGGAMGLFERLYDPVMKQMDWLGFRRWRRWAASLKGGRILEVGIGTGLNLPYLAGNSAIYGVDPNFLMLARARSRASFLTDTHCHLVRAQGESLPFSEGAFDGALVTLVLCTAKDPLSVLLEIRRVLRPCAPVRLVEHVRVNHPLISSVQDFLTPTWSRVAGGCNLNRDTLSLLTKAGFKVVTVKKRVGGLLVALEAMTPAGSFGEDHLDSEGQSPQGAT